MSSEDRERGLYHKYDVRRTDGSSKPGGKHHECAYFVLDLTHDKYARVAAEAYAHACADEFPSVALDLFQMIHSQSEVSGDE